MKQGTKISHIQQAILLLLLTLPAMHASAEILTITGGSLTQVVPTDSAVQTTIISQFQDGQGVSSLSGTVTFVDAGQGLLNITNGTLAGDNGTLEVDYLGNEFFGAFFLSPYSWDLASGVGTGNFACGDADNGTTCASLNPQQSDWDFTSVIGTNFVDSGNGAFLTLDTINARGDTFTWSLTGNVTAVPVPAAAWLFGSGLIGLAGIARRKQALSALPSMAH